MAEIASNSLGSRVTVIPPEAAADVKPSPFERPIPSPALTPVQQAILAPAQRPNINELPIVVRVLAADGRATEYLAPMPTSPYFDEWSFLQQIAMLQNGTFNKVSVPMTAFAIAYAKSKGLDIMEGDVYATSEGRLAISNKAKIKLALRTGLITDYECVLSKTEDPIELPNCSQKTDLICTVTIEVKGFKRPLRRSQRLSEWYMPKNPNWQGRPSHMLELSTFAHLCDLVNPTVEDTAPPEALPALEPSSTSGDNA